MAFSNNVRSTDDRLGATSALTGEKSRSFSALARNSTPDSKNDSNALSVNYGNGTTDWGPNSIWGNGSLGNGLASRATTRESSRDGLRQAGQEEHTKAGGLRSSGSLGIDNQWFGQWKSSANRTVSQVEAGDGKASQEQRSTSHAGLPSFSSSTAVSRPSTISLNTGSTVAPAGHRHATSGTLGGRSYEPAPTVYTKHDRRQGSNGKGMRDSVTGGSWSSVSPTDSRRPFLPSSRTVSQPMSRNNSQQPAASGDDRPQFTRPDYNRAHQGPTHNNPRAPSLSSQGNTPYNGLVDPGMAQLPLHFGQLSMNGDSRPQTSYRSSDTAFSNPYSAGISPSTRPSFDDPGASFTRAEEYDEYDAQEQQYTGLPGSISPLTTTFGAQTYGGRYPPTPTSAEFRLGQSFSNGQMSTRGFETAMGSKSASDWQAMPHGTNALQLGRPSMTAAEQQAFMTPQMQQLLAAQLRQHCGPIFNPYAVSGALNMHGIGSYLPIMPMTFPQVDPNTPVQEVQAGENIQSALLFEFKSNAKSRRYELRDIYGNVAEFAGDQHGSRFIQTKLETANSDEKSKVFDEIAPNAMQLMTDVFGNYVIQKFFDHGDQMHKKILATKMKGQVLTLSNQMYGCRVVQKALDHVLVDQQAQLIRELDGHVLKCVKDQNGNHVIQKAIERCPAHIIGFIINSFQGSVQQLSVNSYGCRVIQRCLEHCDRPAKAIITAELMDGIQGMITDQYGNYVVQHVVERDEGEGRRNVLNIVMKSLELYSKHKFASNVVEKCLEWADDLWRRGVLIKLSSEERRGPEGESVLVGMIKDNYGNYVIRKLRIHQSKVA